MAVPVERDAVAPSARRQNSVANKDLLCTNVSNASILERRFFLVERDLVRRQFTAMEYTNIVKRKPISHNRVRRGEKLNNRSKAYFLQFQRGVMSFSPPSPLERDCGAIATRPRLISRWNAVKWKAFNRVRREERKQLKPLIDRRNIFRSVPSSECGYGEL